MPNILQRTGKSYKEIYQEHFPAVYKIAYSYMKNGYDSEDAAHETFLRLMKQEKPFKDAGHVKAWLVVTVTNICLDMLRRRGRTESSIEDYVNLLAQPGESSGLKEAILAMPETYKTSVYLYYYEGYSTKEIAQMLKKPNETVKTWLKRARAQLKEQLGDDYER